MYITTYPIFIITIANTKFFKIFIQNISSMSRRIHPTIYNIFRSFSSGCYIFAQTTITLSSEYSKTFTSVRSIMGK